MYAVKQFCTDRTLV